jgi:cytochrome c-type biogenesis protein CcmH/NrfF
MGNEMTFWTWVLWALIFWAIPGIGYLIYHFILWRGVVKQTRERRAQSDKMVEKRIATIDKMVGDL